MLRKHLTVPSSAQILYKYSKNCLEEEKKESLSFLQR